MLFSALSWGSAGAEHLTGRIQLADPDQASPAARDFASPAEIAAENAAREWTQAVFVVPRGHRPVAARARLAPAGGELAAECVGGTGARGYQLAFVRVARPQEARAGAWVEVELETAPGASPALARQRFDAEQDRRARAVLRRLVANPEVLAVEPTPAAFAPPRAAARRAGPSLAAAGSGFRPTGEPSLDGSGVRYLVVTSAALLPAFQPLVDWKIRRGMPAAARSIEWIESRTRRGMDRPETLRNFLVEAYALWGVEYVLLGGDTGVLPARFGWSAVFSSTSPTDLYFACLDGNWNADGDALWGEGSLTVDPGEADLVPELAVGRAPVNSFAEAQTFVTKTIGYETPLFDDYQDRATFLAEVLIPANWDSGMTASYDGAVGTEQMIAQSLPDSFATERLYDRYWLYPGAVKLRKSATLAAMNGGTGLVNHLGHGFTYTMSCGDVSLVNADADALANGARTFVLVMANCAAVAFDSNCLAERFLLNPGGGAAGVIGAARSVSASLIVAYNRAIHRAVFENGHVHLGDALDAARLERVTYAELEGSDRWIHFSLNLLGDPEMAVYTARPRQPVLVHVPALPVASDTLAATVTLDSLPVAGARVCAQKEGEVYAVAVSDSAGAVRLAVSPQSVGPLYLSVTASFLATRTDTLQVTPPTGPALAVGAPVVDDDAVPPSDGDGDGTIDAGETVEISVLVANTGIALADSVDGTLVSADPRFVVLQGALAVGDVPAGESRPGLSPLVVQALATAPDGAAADLALELRAAGGQRWQESVHLQICAPRLEVSEVASSPLGGSPDSLAVAVTLRNYGSGKVPAGLATLAVDSLAVVLLDSVPLPAIPPHGEATLSPAFQVVDASGLQPLQLRLEDGRGRVTMLRVDRVPPPAPAIPHADLTVAAGTVRLTWPVSAATDHWSWHVFRAPASGGAFVRLTPDAVRSADYYDGTAHPNTGYLYHVVDVDSSRQWSAPSPDLTVNTTAATIAGWPVPMAEPTASSVAVGDLQGDGTMEVVVGDLGVYAWHSNAQELVDGDNNGTTVGVFNLAPGSLNSSVALADIDDVLGQEIVAASWLTNQIFVWNAAGALLPGWPVHPVNPGNQGYWGSPSVGDLDGDGVPEIAAVSKDGWLYAWHRDGTPLLVGTSGEVRQVGAWTQTTPALADLDGDGKRDLIVSGALAQVHAIRFDGTDVPGWPRTLYALGKGSPAVGDLDDDGDLEVVIHSESDHLWIFEHDGTPRPGWPRVVPGDSPDFGPSPALGDLDGDGRLEIVVASVKLPFSSSCRLLVLDLQGNTLLSKPLELNTQSSPILADLDGDGAIDIVHGGEAGVLHAWTLAGVELAGFPIPLGAYIRGTPQYCDLDADGRGDLVLAGWDKKVHAWSMTGPYRRDRAPWPTFHGDLARTGLLATGFPTPAEHGAPAARLVATWAPNPFNPSVTLDLEVPALGPVTVDVFDARGRRVRRLQDGVLPAGRHRITWDGADARGRAQGSGVYLVRVQSGSEIATRKLSLVR